MIRKAAFLVAGVILATSAFSVLVAHHLVRDSLQQQTSARNEDEAALLGLALSAQAGDRGAMEGLLEAEFKTQRFQTLVLLGRDGTVWFRRDAPSAGSPAGVEAEVWFAQSIRPLPGTAVVTHSKAAVAQVQVQGRTDSANLLLREAVQTAATWMTGLGLALAALWVLVLQYWREQLRRVVAHARDMAQGRLIELDEFGAPEVRAVTAGLNAAARRFRALFESHAGQLDLLRLRVHADPLTGLSNRRHFRTLLDQALARPPQSVTLLPQVAGARVDAGPDASPTQVLDPALDPATESGDASSGAQQRGGLLIVRLRHLEAMNLRVGHDAVDRLLKSMGDLLQSYPGRVTGAFTGRLNGGDLALYLPVNGVVRETAETLRDTLRVALLAVDRSCDLAIGGVDGIAAGPASTALASADLALARAEADGPFGLAIEDLSEGGPVIEAVWRQRIGQALDAGQVRLVEFPVADRHGRLVHLDCPLHVRVGQDGAFDNPLPWLPMASRSRLTQRVDLTAMALALEAISVDGVARVVRTAAPSLEQAGFVQEVARLLSGRPAAAVKLAIEVAQTSSPGRLHWLKSAQALRARGVRLGMAQSGGSIQELAAARAVGLDHVRIDGLELRGVASDAVVAGYAGQMVAAARALGLTVYAGGVSDPRDVQRLGELGFDGVAKPA